MAEPTRGTLLSDVLAEAKEGRTLRSWGLVAEGLLLCGLSVAIGMQVGGAHGGMFSIFLTAAALRHRLGDVLDRNRDDIWQERATPFEANRNAALRLLALFVGIAAAYAATAVLLGTEAEQTFEFALSVAGVDGGSILSRSFGNLAGLVVHNAAVFATVFLLSLAYRTYGTLLALTWNACVWGVVLTQLVSRGTLVTTVPIAVFVPGAFLAILPHFLLEALAYVLASLAAIFTSRAMVKYGLRDARLLRVMLSCATMLGAGVVVLVVAALAEAYLVPVVLGFLR